MPKEMMTTLDVLMGTILGRSEDDKSIAWDDLRELVEGDETLNFMMTRLLEMNAGKIGAWDHLRHMARGEVSMTDLLVEFGPPEGLGRIGTAAREVRTEIGSYLEGQRLSDEEALDRLNLLLSAREWPGASGMEDVLEIVRQTGRQEIPDAPEWERH